MQDSLIAKNFVCVAVDGAAVFQGHRNDLCTKLQTSIPPYVNGIHCMAHTLNLAKYSSLSLVNINMDKVPPFQSIY